MIVTRVEKHNIKPNHPYYHMLDEFCFMSKNLYNFANYQIRQSFTKEDGRFIGYYEMDKLLKKEGMEFDYRNMPSADSAQQCLRLLEKNWKCMTNNADLQSSNFRNGSRCRRYFS